MVQAIFRTKRQHMPLMSSSDAAVQAEFPRQLLDRLRRFSCQPEHRKNENTNPRPCHSLTMSSALVHRLRKRLVLSNTRSAQISSCSCQSLELPEQPLDRHKPTHSHGTWRPTTHCLRNCVAGLQVLKNATREKNGISACRTQARMLSGGALNLEFMRVFPVGPPRDGCMLLKKADT